MSFQIISPDNRRIYTLEETKESVYSMKVVDPIYGTLVGNYYNLTKDDVKEALKRDFDLTSARLVREAKFEKELRECLNLNPTSPPQW